MSESLIAYAANKKMVVEEISMDCEGLVQAKVIFADPYCDEVEVGDFIYYSEEYGKEINFENKTYFIVSEGRVQFFLKGPR